MGNMIECAKHNGRFNLIDGSPARAPICRGLATYPVEERKGRIHLNIIRAGGVGARAQKTCRFRVVSNRNVATFIKELVLEPLDSAETITFIPGDYLQLDIPAYETSAFATSTFPSLSPASGESARLRSCRPQSQAGRRNNYSLASNQQRRLCASMSALPHRRRARTARPELAPAMSLASSPATWSLPLDLLGTFTSSPPNAKWFTSVAAQAWRPCALTSLTCWKAKDRPQDQLLVWGTLAAGDLLRRLFRESGQAAPQLHLPPGSLFAATGGQLDRPHRVHS